MGVPSADASAIALLLEPAVAAVFCVKSGLTASTFAPYMIDHVIHHLMMRKLTCLVSLPTVQNVLHLTHECSMATA
jgi:hypothetical protein